MQELQQKLPQKALSCPKNVGYLDEFQRSPQVFVFVMLFRNQFEENCKIWNKAFFAPRLVQGATGMNRAAR